MDIQFVDVKVQTVDIRSLKMGEVFLTPDDFNDVCVNIGINTDHSMYEYLILGEAPELCSVKGDFQVRPVKAKLIVEI